MVLDKDNVCVDFLMLRFMCRGKPHSNLLIRNALQHLRQNRNRWSKFYDRTTISGMDKNIACDQKLVWIAEKHYFWIAEKHYFCPFTEVLTLVPVEDDL